MSRLIDADALLEKVKVIGNRPLPDVRTLKDLELAIVNTYHAILNEITNAPTVEREGWVGLDADHIKYEALKTLNKPATKLDFEFAWAIESKLKQLNTEKG